MAKNNHGLLFYICKVEHVYDGQDGLRIKVRIPYHDADKATIDELPYAFPLLPKHLHVNPQVGETVIVFTQEVDNPEMDRFFIGPIISQPYYMRYDTGENSRALLNGQHYIPGKTRTGTKIGILPKSDMDPENAGVLPGRGDIAIEGRQNADIVLKDNEIRIRCGYKEEPNSSAPINRLHRNKTDQAYIQMKFDKDGRGGDKKYATSMNVVADRINLLSHDSSDYFDLNDKKDLISDETMSKIMKEAHPVVYGDELIAYLKKLIRVFETHTHPFAQDPPCLDDSQISAINTAQLDEMVSKSIRVN